MLKDQLHLISDLTPESEKKVLTKGMFHTTPQPFFWGGGGLEGVSMISTLFWSDFQNKKK